ncbi:porin [bacterium M00.F.Ca.ET.228.01.1.1]|uniref:porin n=1 Tax=Paraburkholderia phenoliruptrix TaxID=252970 RepID=UPI001092242C|nr:porin [Paraburkholderia phenoliruptrix]TGP39525.1 porin [bacterium M00.F.Ca.ET.228.01.1.1]TGR95259.1 porin [bacterium M00.F.Ca.ET.191.01.1.1]TGT96105.1 porin [bacterium M00.F.Ca.ET.155.01.1.1]MBW0448274.1 porin [Paraburkholderia phenoliruptrix]MBW9099485.1 porin [Paraburkholderia phenoliruptrix]
MKKNLPALLVLTSAGMLCSSAHAQSSVTLYGIIDVGLNYQSNASGGRLFAMTSGVNQGSRFGLAGSEDLGSGLKAIFRLENGFDVTNGKLGQGGLLFGRQAYVGLSGRYGTLTFGRQYDTLIDFVGQYSVSNQWGGYISAHPGDLDNFNYSFRSNNSVKFTSENYGGFSFGTLYSLGGAAGDFTRNQIWSLGAGYNHGPFSIGAAWLSVRNPNTSLFGGNSSTTATAAAANASSPVFRGFLSAHSYRDIGVGASYTLGAATFGATYSNISFRGIGDLSSGPNPFGYTGNATFDNAEVNFNYKLTPAWMAGIAYDYTKGRANNVNEGATYHQVEASTHYFLSKRTDVYLSGIWQHASGTDSTNKPAVAAINVLTPSSSNNLAVVRVGMRHKF